MSKEKILVIGANGQIGSVLTEALRTAFGTNNVIATDIRQVDGHDGPFELLNVLDRQAISEIVNRHGITQIYHLAAILSAKGEQNPLQTWDINMGGLFNVFEVARESGVSKVFFPSSIAVFGADIPRQMTPQNAILKPTTVYGMSKASGELWSQYYFQKYGLDVRSLRYPGVIGWQSDPGGGTTDYAVDIYHNAVKGEDFTCFLSENTALPMIYMADAIRATLELMDAPTEKIKERTSYNLAGMSFSPSEIAESIQAHFPSFEVSYAPDFRQKIADSWPESIDDGPARKDWHWKPKYDLASMTKDMIFQLQKKYSVLI
ncbi:MAG: NAD-dependent epimerase/dehydratase family protein [Saprospiraceae bacterium]|nr:NAD-dependent epimerase/dehydratase family protein [Saprospiraceae bacterium]MCF8248457.1 NAD-dependent epimerase/dehydratase family protein [Saprospiraceae bacterium]MCF8283203.1 NAD-dependent epimerase/dehydratase family protein [Bacteroidales bacterium]MCF8309985.1 NAD-dependent epimerase/dehydratase family protein [Saprospiraceae bacterium]MCF8438684.1 NAD-dependent epimerase/dehydratase family protein [Saprospiraceae bacterium]